MMKTADPRDNRFMLISDHVFDLVGLRRDGGLDLGITCDEPLDGSSPVDDALRRKIESYLSAIGADGGSEIRNRFERDPGAPIRIIVIHTGSICDRVLRLLSGLRGTGSEHGVTIVTDRRDLLH